MQPPNKRKPVRKNSIFFYNSLPSDEDIQMANSVPFDGSEEEVPSLSFENGYLFSQIKFVKSQL